MKKFGLNKLSVSLRAAAALAAVLVNVAVLGGVLAMFDGVSQDHAAVLARAKALPAASAALAGELRKSKRG